MNTTSIAKPRPLRLGIKHGEAIQIGDVIVRISLDAARCQGRRATLVIDNPSGVRVTLMEPQTS